MSKPTNEQRIAETLREHAAKAVPDELDAWHTIRDRISGTEPVPIQIQSLLGQESQAIRRPAHVGKWRKSAAFGGLAVSVAMVVALVLMVALASNDRATSPGDDDAGGA